MLSLLCVSVRIKNKKYTVCIESEQRVNMKKKMVLLFKGFDVAE